MAPIIASTTTPAAAVVAFSIYGTTTASSSDFVAFLPFLPAAALGASYEEWGWKGNYDLHFLTFGNRNLPITS